MMEMATTHPRCGSLVTGAACCQESRHQDGRIIHNHPTLLAADILSLGLLGCPAAWPLVESGSNPTLCLSGGGAMCPGRVLPGHSSWEVSPPGGCHLSFSPPPTSPPLPALIYLIRLSKGTRQKKCGKKTKVWIIFEFFFPKKSWKKYGLEWLQMA